MSVGRQDLPNLISIARILLTLPVAYLLLQDRFSEALLLFFIAGISDALDGYLAKRFGWHSRLGSILDPLADKLLLVTAFVCLGWIGIIPLWLVVMVLGRDLIIILGALAFHLLIGRYEMAPTWISKFNTALQITLILALVLSNGLYPLPDGLLTGLVYGVSVTTVLSGLGYVWTWGRKAYRIKQKQSR
ncbi:CDP-alcohol phosphatidyltransferase [Candidatus Tenderia electrophaga]|jgi:cardiolipin synthase|uniref:CDP-diacylglycerol--glycerol-3-phosphate 3-phosphatidyltransferase n=1 Tax=Candidatus Tenderia electrophaga TaxID=1748243 RepID=A0A0S2TBG6_9GAMM|nr:CDP-alcohol phosphatidyltransferase [Candidatus Tenderia electrophaga]